MEPLAWDDFLGDPAGPGSLRSAKEPDPPEGLPVPALPRPGQPRRIPVCHARIRTLLHRRDVAHRRPFHRPRADPRHTPGGGVRLPHGAIPQGHASHPVQRPAAPRSVPADGGLWAPDGPLLGAVARRTAARPGCHRERLGPAMPTIRRLPAGLHVVLVHGRICRLPGGVPEAGPGALRGRPRDVRGNEGHRLRHAGSEQRVPRHHQGSLAPELPGQHGVADLLTGPDRTAGETPRPQGRRGGPRPFSPLARRLRRGRRQAPDAGLALRSDVVLHGLRPCRGVHPACGAPTAGFGNGRTFRSLPSRAARTSRPAGRILPGSTRVYNRTQGPQRSRSASATSSTPLFRDRRPPILGAVRSPTSVEAP